MMERDTSQDRVKIMQSAAAFASTSGVAGASIGMAMMSFTDNHPTKFVGLLVTVTGLCLMAAGSYLWSMVTPTALALSLTPETVAARRRLGP